jgi:1-acyl-sn-glycerol-3-phosphate acyltransferase
MRATLPSPRAEAGALPARAAMLRPLRASLRLGLFVMGLLFTLLLVATGRALLLLAPRHAGARFGVETIHGFMRFGAWVFGVRVVTTGALPAPGSLVVANHRSYLDAVALASIVRGTFLAKREVASWPIIGLGARMAGIVFVDRADETSRALAGDALCSRLEQGTTVVNFPEGTTSSAGEPLPFHPGLFRRIAGRAVVVVPARIDYDDPEACWIGDDGFVGHLTKVAAQPHTIVRLRFAPPIDAAGMSAPRLLARCREQVTHPA